MEHPYQPIFERQDRLEAKVDQFLESRKDENGMDRFNFIRAEAAADLLGVALPTIRAYTAQKKLIHYKRGHYVYYKISDLNDFIEKGRIDPKRKGALG